MNPMLRNLFIRNFVKQTEKKLKKLKPEESVLWGKVQSMNFLVNAKEEVIVRMVFERYTDDKKMGDEQKEKFQKMLNIDIHKEMIGENVMKKPCKSIFAKIDVTKKTIIVTYNYTDGSFFDLVI